MSVEQTARQLTADLERIEVYLTTLVNQIEQETRQHKERSVWLKKRMAKEEKEPGYYATKMRALRAKRAAEDARRERERILAVTE